MPSKKSNKQVSQVDEEVQQECIDSSQDNNWDEQVEHSDPVEKQEYTRKPSCLDFDRKENEEMEKCKVSELTTEQLLMTVIRRGEVEKNPIIAGGCGRLLKQINSERSGNFRNNFHDRPRYNNNNNNNNNNKQGFFRRDRQDGYRQEGFKDRQEGFKDRQDGFRDRQDGYKRSYHNKKPEGEQDATVETITGTETHDATSQEGYGGRKRYNNNRRYRHNN